MRTATVERKTRETEIAVSLDLDGTGEADIDTGIGFLDHMLESFARHSMIDLKVRAQGDLHVDGDVYDRHGPLDRLRQRYDGHTHPFGGLTSLPD